MTLSLTKPVPAQIVNEGATFGPLDFNNFFQSSSKMTFRAELADGQSLPQGLICMSNGIMNGIPAAGTQGSYKIIVTVTDVETEETTTEFDFTINQRLSMDEKDQLYSKIKSEVWDALGKNLPLPEIGDLLNRPVTMAEVYYLLQQFATLTIWDVYNLEYPSEKNLLKLEGVSEYYNVYDRGCCIIGTPKDLFSHERTLEDTLNTARAMAREVYKRGWVIEFAGFDKMVRAAWVELQLLGAKNGKSLEVLHYNPSTNDLKIFDSELASQQTGPSPQQEI